MTSRLALAEERERRRIASLLHDDLGHSLALAQIRLGKIEQRDTTDLRIELVSVRELISEAIETTRSLTFELSSPVLYELGLEAALQSAMDRLAAATGVRFVFESDGTLARHLMPEDKRVLLYRSVRELLLNAAKHAQALEVTVTVSTVGDEVHIGVSDNGIGFDVAEVMAPTGSGVGHGLLAAAEQVRSMAGRFEMTPAPAKGTRCLIVVPLGSEYSDPIPYC